MRMRFWGGSSARDGKIRATRWSRNFLGTLCEIATATRSTPKPYMNASQKTSGIGSVVAGLIDCVLISGLVCGLPGFPREATGPDADTLTAASSGRRTLEVRGFGQAYAITV